MSERRTRTVGAARGPPRAGGRARRRAAAPAAPAGAGDLDLDRPVERLVIVSLPGVSWAEARRGDMPVLDGLVRESAVGVMSSQIGRAPATTTAAYLTIGAGTRAVVPGIDTGVALNPDELHGGVPATDILRRRLGSAVPGIAYLPVGAALDANADSTYGAVPGTLGDELFRAGIARAVIANADAAEGFPIDELPPDGAYSRSAATALMGLDGIVPEGTVGRDLLLEDPDAPFGRRFARSAVLEAFDRSWLPDRREVVLLEASDLSRAAAYGSRSTPDQRIALRREALEDADALLGDVLDRVDPATDAVLVLSPVAPGGSGMVALRAPDVEPGLLRSATTRRAGYVLLADVAPTVLTLMGVEPPTSIEGRAFGIEAGEGDRVGALIDQGERRPGSRRPAAGRGPGRHRRPGPARRGRGRRRPPAAPGPPRPRARRRRPARRGAGHLPGRPPRRRPPGRRRLRRGRASATAVVVGVARRPGRAALAPHRHPRRPRARSSSSSPATCSSARPSRSTPCSATRPRWPAASPGSATWPSPCSARRR